MTLTEYISKVADTFIDKRVKTKTKNLLKKNS